jgi:hypothetical protein
LSIDMILIIFILELSIIDTKLSWILLKKCIWLRIIIFKSIVSRSTSLIWYTSWVQTIIWLGFIIIKVMTFIYNLGLVIISKFSLFSCLVLSLVVNIVSSCLCYYYSIFIRDAYILVYRYIWVLRLFMKIHFA